MSEAKRVKLDRQDSNVDSANDKGRSKVREGLSRVAQGAAGLSLLGVTAAGANAYFNNPDNDFFDKKVDFKVGAEASPSDDMAEMFDDGMDALAVGGGAVLAYGGLQNIKRAVRRKDRALYELAVEGLPGNKARKVVAAGAIATLGATIFGVSHDIGRAVGGAQTSALEAIANEDDFPRDTKIISKGGTPELATTPNVPNEVLGKLFETKEKIDSDVDVIPMYYSWENVIREKDKNEEGSSKKILSVVMGLPPEVTDLPETKSDDKDLCKATPINAAPVLGNIGDKIIMAGGTYVIKGHLDGSGPNTVPIAMNTADYARCFTGNETQQFNLVALRGEDADVEKLIKESDITGVDKVGTETVRESTMQDFFDETERTSKNNSNGLVLTFLAISAAASAAAIGYKAKDEMTRNRATNSMLLAQGVSRRNLMEIADIKSDRQAFWSTIASMPLVAAADYSTVASTPGAVEVAPSAATALVVLAATTAIGRVSNRVVAPNKLHELNPAQRGE